MTDSIETKRKDLEADLLKFVRSNSETIVNALEVFGRRIGQDAEAIRGEYPDLAAVAQQNADKAAELASSLSELFASLADIDHPFG